MKNHYALKTLEEILKNLNAQFIKTLSAQQVDELIETISMAKTRVYNRIQDQVFHLKAKQQTSLLIQKYTNALTLLINKAYLLSTHQELTGHTNLEAVEYLLITLEELLQFLEIRYTMYLSPQKRVAIPELLALKAAIAAGLPSLPAILEKGKNPPAIIEITLDAFKKFIDRIDAQEPITAEEAEYHRGLFNDLLHSEDRRYILNDCPSLHEILFLWNFNSQENIAYFTEGLEELLSEEPTQDDKLEFMRFQFRRLLHLPVLPKTIYDKNYPSIKIHFCEWLRREISYLEQKKEGFAPLVRTRGTVNENRHKFKVLVDFSADQISLLLRGMKDAKILVAKTFDTIFQAIVPHLSTKQREDLSPKSVQKKAYAGEDRDKRVVVMALQQIIEKVNSY